MSSIDLSLLHLIGEQAVEREGWYFRKDDIDFHLPYFLEPTPRKGAFARQIGYDLKGYKVWAIYMAFAVFVYYAISHSIEQNWLFVALSILFGSYVFFWYGNAFLTTARRLESDVFDLLLLADSHVVLTSSSSYAVTTGQWLQFPQKNISMQTIDAGMVNALHARHDRVLLLVLRTPDWNAGVTPYDVAYKGVDAVPEDMDWQEFARSELALLHAMLEKAGKGQEA
jgi:hypothetical protein